MDKMTAKQQEQMPERIYAYKTCGAVYTSTVNAEHIKNYAINAEYIRADLCPAKAVQGDLQGMDGHDEPCAKCGVKCNALSANFTITPVCLWIGGEFTTHCAKCVIKALTPESEGIAGKGEVCKWCNGTKELNNYHCKDGQLRSSYGQDCPMCTKLEKVTAISPLRIESTIARPQEIDVEGIRERVADVMESAFEGDDLGDVARDVSSAVIDHLHSSGYLSAPHGKKE